MIILLFQLLSVVITANFTVGTSVAGLRIDIPGMLQSGSLRRVRGFLLNS